MECKHGLALTKNKKKEMSATSENLIEEYLDFFAGTEPPTIFNRWTCIGGIGALLERNCWVMHGHKRIYPNQYIMLVGESGSRKSTSIKTFLRPFLEAAEYRSIAANKTTKEKFLIDLEVGMDKLNDPDEHLNVQNIEESFGRNSRKSRSYNPTMRELFGVRDTKESQQCLILSDDFNVFLGHGNIEFIELITDLWDYEGFYRQRLKTGKSVLIPNPTLSIVGGNTQLGISMSFPPEVIGQGLFSRLIMVFSDPSGRRITFPKPPDQNIKKKLIEKFVKIRHEFKGEIKIDPFAIMALDDIYQNWKELSDVRFRSYSTRRFDHLLKLSMCCAAARGQQNIDRTIVEYANTILHWTESFMPKALGEFGKAKHSDISAKILTIIEEAEKLSGSGLSLDAIYTQMHRDVEGTLELGRILQGLMGAKKIQQTKAGFLPYKEPAKIDFPYYKPILLKEYAEQIEKEAT